MRQVITGWILIAGCIVLLGMAAAIWAQTMQGRQIPTATAEEWRQYAKDVEQGRRTPSASMTRLLTETAISQNIYASSALQLLRLVGAAMAVVGLLLGVDLVRHRARAARPQQE
jgi:hypothetical protein